MSKRARMDELADKLGLDTEPTPPAPVPVQEPVQPKNTVLRKTKTDTAEPLTQMNLNPCPSPKLRSRRKQRPVASSVRSSWRHLDHACLAN